MQDLIVVLGSENTQNQNITKQINPGANAIQS